METVVLLPSALVFVLSIWVVIICPESFLASLDGAVVIFHLLIGVLQVFEESHTVGLERISEHWAECFWLQFWQLTLRRGFDWQAIRPIISLNLPTNKPDRIVDLQTWTSGMYWHLSAVKTRQLLMFIHVYFWQLADRHFTSYITYYISLLIIPCITIMWQIKKPWTLNQTGQIWLRLVSNKVSAFKCCHFLRNVNNKCNFVTL